ncbi:RNA polymerase sigma factor [Wenzhouxiangella sp. AB-CW3]|uniref:RNA polymerase sigma factor n=1 Tax=Wenzhouxiangella sp. AB-CW3 TaxID=2771012 RepID=UPI00168B9F23|nr:RNA polymerase sigma factor [Wenzhouxiangella sp. AB-CW3]QOC22402.1 RNA polymerase sigma factor [Wenzhouxiangella sp. AB-CW3]
MKQPEEDLMVLAAQDGNERAFEFLFHRYHDSLLRFATGLSRDRELARDAVQEAWFGISRRLRRLDDPRAFRSWVFRAVRWQVLDRLKARRDSHVPLDQQEIAAPADDRVQQGRALAEWIAELPELERQALHLFYLDGMKIAEMAAVLEIPAGTVKSRLNRARNQLRALAEEGDDDEYR